MLMYLRLGILGLLFISGLTACGSSSGTGADAGNRGDSGGIPSGGAKLTWKDDGVDRTTLFATATRVTSSMRDMLQIAGGNSSGMGIAFGMSTPPPLAPATFACSQNGTGGTIVSISYTSSGVGPVASGCTINLVTVGASSGTRAVGTFSATFPLDAGGTKSLTDGVFDLPLTVNTL